MAATGCIAWGFRRLRASPSSCHALPAVTHASHGSAPYLRPVVCRAVQLYSKLSAPGRPCDTWTYERRVLLVEGPLSREDMRFLKCVADEVHCRCELRYKVPPPAITQGERLADGAEGQPPAAADGAEGQ